MGLVFQLGGMFTKDHYEPDGYSCSQCGCQDVRWLFSVEQPDTEITSLCSNSHQDQILMNIEENTWEVLEDGKVSS